MVPLPQWQAQKPFQCPQLALPSASVHSAVFALAVKEMENVDDVMEVRKEGEGICHPGATGANPTNETEDYIK